MKHLLKYITKLTLAIAMLLPLYSCEDEEITHTLNGIWEGEVATEYFDHRWNSYSTDYQYVNIEFYADPYQYAKGTGIEYDYYGNSNRYSECEFRFEVRNGVIYIDYEDGTNVAISNYRLNNNYFEGDFVDYWSRRYIASFKLSKVYNWRHHRYTRSNEDVYKLVPNPAQEKTK